MIWSTKMSNGVTDMHEQQMLRILVMRGEDCYVGQCLEFDVCTQAPDEQALHERMDCLLEVEIAAAAELGQPLDRAPERFHKMWNEVSSIQSGAHQYGKLAA